MKELVNYKELQETENDSRLTELWGIQMRENHHFLIHLQTNQFFRKISFLRHFEHQYEKYGFPHYEKI